ncbi:MAG: DUF5711 family protein [Lachnospiraceae bacterium]|nr:DUF5711 family protein [Lachnospiraceae bacterium]
MHKKRNSIIIGIVLVFVVLSASMYQFFRYDTYDVEATFERNDEDGTKYDTFDSNLIKYSSDGAFYTKEDGSLIWNVSYEYANPTLKKTKDYVLIYDERGRGLELMDKEGVVLTLEMNMSIRRAAISNTGVIAILMEENHISYLQLYASDGKKIAEGVIYPQNSGFPVSIALSSDGKLLMVSEIDISEKKISSRVVFYNFGRVGQNESDNIVASYLYEDETIPDVCFMKDDTPIAYSGETIHIFSKSEKPKESKEIKYESKIRSIENDGSNFVVITENDNPEDSNAYLLEVFNKSGHRIGKRSFDYSYDSVSILPGSQIVIIDGNKINFYSRIGVNSFSGEMESNVYAVLSRGNGSYTVIENNKSSRIRLR